MSRFIQPGSAQAQWSSVGKRATTTKRLCQACGAGLLTSTGKKLFCDSCASERIEQQQREYRARKQEHT